MDRPLTEVLVTFTMVIITCLSILLANRFLLSARSFSESLNAKYCTNALALAISRSLRVSTPQIVKLPYTIGVQVNGTILTVSIGGISESIDARVHVLGGGVSNCFLVYPNGSSIIVKPEVVK